MIRQLIDKYDQPVPRYTSYPTAPNFHAGIDAEIYRRWLHESDPDQPLSLYLHVPYCSQMCWYCGCHTKVSNRYEPVADFVDLLIAEIDLMAGMLDEAGGRPRRVAHLHWGGGTPNVLAPDDFRRVMRQLTTRFQFLPSSIRAVELDPRWFSNDLVQALRESRINRASLGVQDFDPQVQQAIGRLQPLDLVRRAVTDLRSIGVGSINLDLIYGLPYQTVASLTRSIELAVALQPDRLSLFGYAHVPWMKPHQRLIESAALPDAAARWQLYQAALATIQAHGYIAIGLDHFAKPGDELAMAAQRGVLKRNFQGYTTDTSALLIGLGPSAISTLPQGYVQNDASIHGWSRAMDEGRLPIVRGVALSGEDRLRRALIEGLMCNGTIDLQALAGEFGAEMTLFDDDLRRLSPLIDDGLVVVDGASITMTPAGQPLIRVVSACFDRYLHDATAAGIRRHSRAV